MSTAHQLICQEFVEVVTDYLEGALEGSLARAAEAHLARCDACVEFLAQMRLTVAELGRVPADRLSATSRTELVDAFRDWSATSGR